MALIENKNKIEISVIMTALNEEANIALAVNNVLEAFCDYNLNSELIVVNDGSNDKTPKLVQDIIDRNERVRMISHNRPMGVGASFWDGVDLARGDIVTWLPGDNENDPWEIFRYHKLLEHVDIVIPFIFNREVRSPFRNMLSYIYRVIINTTFHVNFNYTNGTNLYRRSILKELKFRSNGFFFQTDILIRTVKKGYLFAEVPYRLGLRNHGASKSVNFSSLFGVVKGYLLLMRDVYFTAKAKFDTENLAGDSLSAKRYRGEA